jgi:hypothetical protein
VKISKTTKTFGFLYEIALAVMSVLLIATLIMAIAFIPEKEYIASYDGILIFLGIIFLFLILFIAITVLVCLVLTIVNLVYLMKMRHNYLSKGFLIANMVIQITWVMGIIQFVWRIALDRELMNINDVFPYILFASVIFIGTMALGVAYSVSGLRDIKKYEKEKWLNFLKANSENI